jgi:hypothetical protein
MPKKKMKADAPAAETVEGAPAEGGQPQDMKAYLEQVATVLENEARTGALRGGFMGTVGGPVTDAAVDRIWAVISPLGPAGIKALINKILPKLP